METRQIAELSLGALQVAAPQEDLNPREALFQVRLRQDGPRQTREESRNEHYRGLAPPRTGHSFEIVSRPGATHLR